MNGLSIRIHRLPATITAIFLVLLFVYIVNFYQEERPAIYGMLRNQNKVNMRKLLIGAVQASQRGGIEVLEIANTRKLHERSKGKTDEGANDPVTEADARSHCVMKHGLNRIFPRVTIISEEDKETCNNLTGFDLDPTVLHETADTPDELVDIRDVTVWIDPLDATQEFTEELYEYVTTMVCVAVRGKPVIGVVHRPFTGQTAWAWVGHSMSEYLSELQANNADVDAKTAAPIITVSRSHPGQAKQLITAVFGKSAKILTAAGAGYKVLQVIANNATAYLHSTKIKKWDICAGDAILSALGGTMTTLQNEVISYSTAGSPVNTQGLLAVLKRHDFYIDKVITYRKSEHS